jgi:hypothetical protein
LIPTKREQLTSTINFDTSQVGSLKPSLLVSIDTIHEYLILLS